MSELDVTNEAEEFATCREDETDAIAATLLYQT
jgi:hypothetical protein